MILRTGAAVFIAAGTLALAGAARADGLVPPVVTVNCSPAGPAGGCNGWFKVNVTVTFSWSTPPGESFYGETGCNGFQVTADTAGQAYSCVVTLQDASGSTVSNAPLTGSVKRDTTPPNVTSLALARNADANGWYNHPVGVTASGSDATSGIASCTTMTYGGPDSSSATVSGTCTDNAGNVSAPVTLSLKYDATPPSVSASAARGPDANGWYNHPVGVSFKGSDATSGIAGCSSSTYSGPDNGGASVGGTCSDQAGNVGSASLALKYDTTPPTVTGAAPDRQPDDDGWYNHKVVVTFSGSDSTSGIASCDSVAYDKPDSAKAVVQGRCTDNAGNASAPTPFGFKYDSTPPKLSALSAQASDGSVSLTWKASADVADVVVTRRLGDKKAAMLYSGKRITHFRDKKVRNGARYQYFVVAADAAGNKTTQKTIVMPSAPLYAPRARARVSGGSVILRWRPVAHAKYYNLQLWLGGVKLLSSWPSGTRLRVPHTWTYLGHAYRLRPGHYTWFVWPGRGPRSKHRFGPMLGKSSFLVVG
jgi:hypothetical protein